MEANGGPWGQIRPSDKTFWPPLENSVFLLFFLHTGPKYLHAQTGPITYLTSEPNNQEPRKVRGSVLCSMELQQCPGHELEPLQLPVHAGLELVLVPQTELCCPRLNPENYDLVAHSSVQNLHKTRLTDRNMTAPPAVGSPHDTQTFLQTVTHKKTYICMSSACLWSHEDLAV